LGIGFGVAVLLLCFLGAFSLLQASRLHEGTAQLSRESLPKVQIVGDVRALTSLVRKTTLEALLANDAQDRALQRTRHDSALKRLDSTLTVWKRIAILEEERRFIDQFNSAWSAYVAQDEKANTSLDAVGSSAGDNREQLAADSGAAFNPVAVVLDKAILWERTAAMTAGSKADVDFDRAVVTTGIVLGLSLAFCAVIAVVTTRSIIRPVRSSVEIATTVAQGDLSMEVDVQRKDETGQLLTALRDMNIRLRDVVERVHASGEKVAQTASEIATGSADLSQRTEEQAASLQETAASMQELTEAVRRNAENVQQGHALAANALEVVGRAETIVQEVVETMRDISSNSARVAEINAMIEGIAAQTNILALNAAVEAARAGEQGRGFAVVASEVRTLSQRCAVAAKQVKELVDQSGLKVNAGSTLVQEAGGTMQSVLVAVSGFTELMTSISAALDEQRAGIEQINVAVAQMDQTTQRNAVLVQHSAAAALAMADQSAELQQAVGYFHCRRD
jgi:methyl-accepting chemotaxis protein